jgi:hypothetical protein
VKGHGLLADRGTQPLDLRAGLLELDLLDALATPARHRDRQRLQRALLRGRTDRTVLVRSTPYCSASSRWVAEEVNTAVNTSYFCEGASFLRLRLARG